MDYEQLLFEKKDSIATIILNRPEKLNAFTPQMRESLLLAVDEIAKDDEVRVVILTGAGRGFCSGADVSSLANRTRELYRRALPQLPRRDVTSALPRLNKPIIAAINGPCTGAGFSVAMSCDIRIASATARFGAAQIARGLFPGEGLSYFLPLVIGLPRALELMFTAELISATKAERLGIVSRVVAPDDLMRVTRELAAKIVQQAPIPVALTKKAVWRDLIDELDRQLDLEGPAQRICRESEDHKEGVRSFLEKRPPQFKGR